jgi:regulator of replication initiation timing
MKQTQAQELRSHASGDGSEVANPAAFQMQSTGLSDKLRESLLRVSREHYRSIKQVEVLEQSLEDMKVALKQSDQRNRQLKLEIDELQSHHSEQGAERGAGQGNSFLPLLPQQQLASNGQTSKESDRNISSAGGHFKRSYGRHDDRFQVRSYVELPDSIQLP